MISCKKLVGWGQLLRKTSNNISLHGIKKWKGSGDLLLGIEWPDVYNV